MVAGTEDEEAAEAKNETYEPYESSEKRYLLQNAHLDFIDNVKEIVTKRDIIPKFYEGELSVLLMRTTIIVFLTAVVTVSKLIFEKHQ